MNWIVCAVAGAYTAGVFIAGAFFGRWVWIRVTRPAIQLTTHAELIGKPVVTIPTCFTCGASYGQPHVEPPHKTNSPEPKP